jgi:DNA-binding helix-hairpin-helix protein with protein kinase domain
MADRYLSLEGRTLRLIRSGTPVSVGERIGEGGQGVVHATFVGGDSCVVKWYRAVPKPTELRKSIAALIDRGCPHPAFIWPIDIVVSDEMPGFGYVMPRLEPSYVSLGALLARPEAPSFRVLITIARRLVSAFGALHGSGLCYRDISFGHLWADSQKAEIAVIDNDNVGLDGDEVFVWGTMGFMAPEVVRREMFPSVLSDLHSLAVFLFYLFIHGHPLEGIQADSLYSWTAPRSGGQEVIFGQEPLFVFDAEDNSNRPPAGDPMLVWWSIYPRFFQELFEQAFTTGLHDPVSGRVREKLWLSALTRLCDCVSVCACNASVFYDPDDPGLKCWNCGQIPPKPPLLRLPHGTVVLSEGASITSQHLYGDRKYDTIVGMVEKHPERATELVLRNVGHNAWTLKPDGESALTVLPTRRLGVRAMSIDFGSVQGRISSVLLK